MFFFSTLTLNRIGCVFIIFQNLFICLESTLFLSIFLALSHFVIDIFDVFYLRGLKDWPQK